MTLESADEDDDSAEIEELLATLEGDESYSRYDHLYSSNDSHAEAQLDNSSMHAQEGKRPPFSNTHDQVEAAACDGPRAHVHHAHLHADASNDTVAGTLQTSPSKSSHVHHREMRGFAADTPPSPPCGCSCFLLPSHKRVKEQKKNSEVKQKSIKINPKIQQGRGRSSDDDDKDDEWPSVQKNSGPHQMDNGGLFDVKQTEKEFKRASKKEKQLTQESQKFLKMVAST